MSLHSEPTPARTARRPGPRAAAAATLLALGALLGSGCLSPEAARQQADEEAYALVEKARAALVSDADAFTIEPDPDSLRERLLRGEVEGIEPLTLVDCLRIGAENSRDYRSRRERLYLAALDLTLERWRFTIQQGGSFAALLEGTGDEATDASAAGRMTFTRLLGSGAAIVADIGLDLARALTFSDDWDPIGDAGLAITQPLLRGYGERIVQEPLTQAERDLVYEARAFERFRRTFAVDVASRYFRLLQQQDTVSNQQRNQDNLTQLTQRNEELARAGRLSDIEFGQARQDELRSRAQLIEDKERLEEQRDLFSLFLGLPIGVELPLDDRALADLASDPYTAAAFGPDQAIDFALGNRLDFLTELDRRDDASRRVVVAEDALRMRLDLAGDVRWTSEEGQPLDFQDPEWSIGFVGDLPIDQLPERNVYRAATIAEQAAARDVEQLADEIRAELRAELRETGTRLESWKIQVAAVDLAEKRIDSTQLKLEAGRADTRDLLEAQESLLDAQNAATQALIEYTLARLELYRDLEVLRVDEQGVRVERELLEALHGATEEAQP